MATDREAWITFAAAVAVDVLNGILKLSDDEADEMSEAQGFSGERHALAAHLTAKHADALLAASKSRTFEDEKGGWVLHDGIESPLEWDTLIELENGDRLPASHINWQRRFRYRLVDGEKR